MAHKYFSGVEKNSIFSDQVKFEGKYSPQKILDNYAKLVPKKEELNSVLFMDLKIYLAEDILVKIDRMSMNNSLESRIPFLDNFLSEYSAAIPFDYKLRFGEKKYILKKALKGKLPEKIFNAKKQGFGIPLPKWVYGTLNERINSLFYENGSQMQKFFKKEEIEKIISYNSPKHNATKAWALLSFAVWHKIFIEETAPKKVF